MATIEELNAMIDRPERKVEEYEGWKFGQRVEVLDDDENEGLYEGDEGNLLIEKVGAPEYGNERTAVFIVIDGTDSPTEVRDLSYIEGV